MICQQCRTQLSRLQWQQRIITFSPKFLSPSFSAMRQCRPYSDSSIPTIPPPSPQQPESKPSRPLTISSTISSATPGVSQLLSTPEGASILVDPAKNITNVKVLSSCEHGTKLNGLNYFKNKPDIFALEDSAYPEWLWTLLDDSNKMSRTEVGGVDPTTLNKKQRKKYEKKMAALAASLPRKIPLHEQAIDITPAPYNTNGEAPRSDMIVQAAGSIEKRTEIRKSARQARRKGIREANFLRGL